MRKLDVLVEGAAIPRSGDAGAEPRYKELWVDYVLAEPHTAPDLPGWNTYKNLGGDERVTLDAARLRYHSAGLLVTTPDVERINDAILDAMLLNQAAPSGARRSVVIDGPAGAGKSTLVKMIARDYERALRARHPHMFTPQPGGDLHIPVVYLSVPSGASPKVLTAAFARYLAAPISKSKLKKGNMADLTHPVLDCLLECATALVIVDDAHFVDCSQKDGKLANDHLKNLANFCPATFVLVGVDVEAGGLFGEGRSPGRATQTAGRFAVHRMDFQAVDTPAQQKTWARTIWAFESAFDLYNHTAGELASGEWRYLHERSGGRISTLSGLLRHGAQKAILDGTEQVTRASLDTVITDVSTQRTYEEVQKKRKTRSRRTRQPAKTGS